MKGLFLDRDGVINVDHGYVYKPEKFEFMPGIFELCAQAQSKGYLIFVITNQSGIARELYSENDFARLTLWMKEQFERESIVISHVYFCPHHPNYPYRGVSDCSCRKPSPGMLMQASKEYSIDLKSSIFIGDKESDMQAAYASGIPKRYLIHAHSREEKVKESIATDSIESLLAAISLLT